MQLSNLEHLPNHTIVERLDVVYGSTVRSKHVGKDFLAGLKNIVGGELTSYTDLLEEAREEALQRMITKAQALGADAVVGSCGLDMGRLRADWVDFCCVLGGDLCYNLDFSWALHQHHCNSFC